jgi:hypothetical protein
MSRLLYRIACIAPLLGAPLACAQSDLQEGLWEVSVSMSIAGQPASTQPLVMRQCISHQTAQGLIAQLNGVGACNTSDLQQDEGRASWKLSCSGQVELEASGQATFMGDSFNGAMAGELGMGTQRMPFTQTFSARRVGECK